MSVKKSLYLLTYVNEDGEEELLEVPAYSADQAEFLSGGIGRCISCEKTVHKAPRMEEGSVAAYGV